MSGDLGDTFAKAKRLPMPPIEASHLNLALWVHVDADGTATYGGRMPADEVVLTLRFLADHLAALIPAPEQELEP